MSPGRRSLLTAPVLALSACSLFLSAAAGDLTCDGGPSFSPEALEGPADAENGPGSAAEALRRHLARDEIDIDSLPDAGWIEVSRTDASAFYLTPDPAAEGSWIYASVDHDGEGWEVDGWGGCSLQPDVGPGLGIASFRIAPDVELDPDSTEVAVLVTERACNSGQDARGRIVVAAIDGKDDRVTVTLAVRPRGGAQTCPSNPETPFILELPEPLGDRALLDGSSVPPRDATICPDIAMCS